MTYPLDQWVDDFHEAADRREVREGRREGREGWADVKEGRGCQRGEGMSKRGGDVKEERRGQVSYGGAMGPLRRTVSGQSRVR